MKTLHLNLMRVWFDMVRIGTKPEEYRDISLFYISLLFNWNKQPNWSRQDYLREFQYHGNELKLIEKYLKDFDTVTFSHGYAKDRDQFQIKLFGIDIAEGKPEWGAIPGKKYFVIKLGKLIK